MVMEEVGVSEEVIRPDTVPSYRTAGCDLNPAAVHSHSLSPHAASNPNTRFVIRPSIPPPLTQPTERSLFPIDSSQGNGGRICVIQRRWQIQRVRGGEEDSPCRPEVCLPDTVGADLCACARACAQASACGGGDEAKRDEGEKDRMDLGREREEIEEPSTTTVRQEICITHTVT